MNKVFKERCNNKANHPWKEMARYDWGLDEGMERVILWCPVCGSVLINYEYDNRPYKKGTFHAPDLAYEEQKRQSKIISGAN